MALQRSINISTFFSPPNLEKEIEGYSGDISKQDQQAYYTELRNKLNSFKTEKEQVAYLKRHRQNKDVLMMQKALWGIPMSNVEFIDNSSINLHYKSEGVDISQDEKKHLNRNMINAAGITKKKRDEFRSQNNNEIGLSPEDNGAIVDKQIDNISARKQAYTSKESVFNMKKDYIKRDKHGVVKRNKHGDIKKYRGPQKAAINFANNSKNSAIGKAIKFILFNLKGFCCKLFR